MPNTWENGGHVDHNPSVEARAAHLMGHQRRVARSAVAIQTGCRAACREQTAADVLEARKALLLFLSVRRGVYEKGPVRSLYHAFFGPGTTVEPFCRLEKLGDRSIFTCLQT